MLDYGEVRDRFNQGGRISFLKLAQALIFSGVCLMYNCGGEDEGERTTWLSQARSVAL
jgi:hypothetical protein